ncbi:MAG: sulfur oxidation c-type cytochrome SoxA [Burkholderiaceae bacterium]|nr:sulfur oxidation c-type cytochrome SoxA [Burkholderiaceae bacterium]
MLKKIVGSGLLALALGGAGPIVALAQSDSEKAIDRYRELVADGNPAELWEAKGEALWKQKRGPKNASLEKCDLGQGPGVVKGAYVTLPRYFSDVKRVQDLETRLVTCMEQHQGIQAKAGVYDRDDHKDIISLVAWIASESRGMPVSLPQGHPEERRMYELGKQIFFYRAGPYDFACATCHGEDGKRIRLQVLPNLTKNDPAGRAFTSWPAYRVSNSQLWPMQKRLEDCFRQQRFPYVEFGSDVTIALSSYMGVTGKGVKSLAPTIKR